jgi:hypothetical protein
LQFINCSTAFRNRSSRQQDIHDPHLADLDHQLEGPRIQKVTHEHTGLIAEDTVGRVLATPQVRGIYHVIVEQRGRVYEFNNGGGDDVPVAPIATGARSEQRDQWPKPLAAAANDVMCHAVDQRHVTRGDSDCWFAGQSSPSRARTVPSNREFVDEVHCGLNNARDARFCTPWSAPRSRPGPAAARLSAVLLAVTAMEAGASPPGPGAPDRRVRCRPTPLGRRALP